jgi:hypothetical protein
MMAFSRVELPLFLSSGSPPDAKTGTTATFGFERRSFAMRRAGAGCIAGPRRNPLSA